MNTQPNFKISADAIALANRLRQLQIGEVITYEEMNRLISPSNTQGRGRQSLYSARKILLAEQAVFGCITGVGLKRLNDLEIVEKEHCTIRSVRKTVKKSMRRLSVVNYDQLPPSEKTTHRLTSATLGALVLCTGRPAQLQLEQKARSSEQLQIGDALQLFAAKA